MRPPRRQQPPLYTPLNRILGTEANVRILRVLSGTREITAGELARRAALSRQGVYSALSALEDAGIVSFVGTGAQRLVRFRRVHPLAESIRSLFRAEAQRVEDLVGDLRKIVEELRPPPVAAWLEPASQLSVSNDGTLVCYILDSPGRLSVVTSELEAQLAPVERKADIAIEVRGITRADLIAREAGTVTAIEDRTLLSGVPPDALIPVAHEPGKPTIQSHSDLETRSLRLAIAVSEKLKNDPDAITRARRRLATRLKTASGRELPELREWERVLTTMSPGRLRRFLTESSERATRLRQTLPLLDVLTPSERRGVLAAVTDAEALAAVAKRRSGTGSKHPDS